MSNPYAPFTPPFQYHCVGWRISDQNGRTVLDVRGFGFMTALVQLSEDEAEAVIDKIGNWIVDKMNKDCGL